MTNNEKILLREASDHLNKTEPYILALNKKKRLDIGTHVCYAEACVRKLLGRTFPYLKVSVVDGEVVYERVPE